MRFFSRVVSCLRLLPFCTASHDEKGKLIIIVPSSAPLGSIVMSNVLPFLTEGVYVQNSDSGLDPLAKDSLEIKRKIGDKMVTFEIVSSGSTAQFRNSQWARVVAMFSNGLEF